MTYLILFKRLNFYNYADDNTMSYSNKCLTNTTENFKDESLNVKGWFKDNCTQADSLVKAS